MPWCKDRVPADFGRHREALAAQIGRRGVRAWTCDAPGIPRAAPPVARPQRIAGSRVRARSRRRKARVRPSTPRPAAPLSRAPAATPRSDRAPRVSGRVYCIEFRPVRACAAGANLARGEAQCNFRNGSPADCEGFAFPIASASRRPRCGTMAAMRNDRGTDERLRELARGEAVRLVIPRAGRMRAGSADRGALSRARRFRRCAGGTLAEHGRRSRVLAVAARADHRDAGTPLWPAARAPDACGDEGAGIVRLRRAAADTRSPDAHLRRRGRRTSSRLRRRQPARCGLRRQRRPGVERQPDHGRGRRERRAAVRRHCRCGWPARGSALDGRGRIRLGALAARDVRVPDRPRTRRAGRISRKRKPRSSR